MKKTLFIFVVSMFSFNYGNELICSFTPPSGWLQVPDDKLPTNTLLLVKESTLHTLPASLNLCTETYNGKMDPYIEHVKKQHQTSGYSGWTDMGTLQTDAGPTRFVLFEAPTEWGMAKLMQVFLQKEKTLFVLTATTLESDFPRVYLDFFKSIRSLKITEKGG